MTPQEEFNEAMHDIHKYSLLIGLEDQELLQRWVKRLVQAGNGSGQGPGKALDYALYLSYQLQRGQLRFPFSQPPAQSSLTDLKELLFGVDSVADADLSTTCHAAGFRDTKQRALEALTSTGHALSSCGPETSWDSHRRTTDEASDWDWESHIVDPKGEREVAVCLEELAEDAPLWVLLTRVSPHTRDGGALMHAIVAEELAEWSARLGAEQGLAVREENEVVVEEEEWGPRADRRVDYWHEVVEAQKRLCAEDPKAAEQLTADINAWLGQQCKQMQVEYAQLQAVTNELKEIKYQVTQSRRWKETQFDTQNRALITEVAALKDSISKNRKRLDNLHHAWRDPNSTNPSLDATKNTPISIDSLNTSEGLNNTNN